MRSGTPSWVRLGSKSELVKLSDEQIQHPNSNSDISSYVSDMNMAKPVCACHIHRQLGGVPSGLISML